MTGLRTRRAWLAAAAPLAAAVGAGLALAPRPPIVLWNATASAPLGLYRLSSVRAPRVGDWVALRPPRPLAAWLAAYGYLPLHVPLLKRVAAVGGQRVCRLGDQLTVDGRAAARTRARDRRGRSLPAWGGCRELGADEIFLLNAPPDSLDGRYFGPSRTGDLLARATPLWTRTSAP
jgi:conjugative transfer signal peptidase TraF